MVVIVILIDLPLDDRAGLGDYMQFTKYTHTCVEVFVISIIDPPSGGSMRVA